MKIHKSGLRKQMKISQMSLDVSLVPDVTFEFPDKICTNENGN